MASGITAEDVCVTEFETFKLQNYADTSRRAFLIFRIQAEKIVLKEQGTADATWQDFVDTLTRDPKDGAYGVFDFAATTKEGRQLQKIVFVSWTPDSGLPVKQKMMYASAREPFKQQLGSGLAFVVQASDLSDLAYDKIAHMVGNRR